MNKQVHAMSESNKKTVVLNPQFPIIIQDFINKQMSALLEHPYFQACRLNTISPTQMLGIMKNLYGFSVYFERILARRISHYNSQMDEGLLKIAKQHLREEIGHADLFRDCLLQNGMSIEEVRAIKPSRYTKAIYGYLIATIEYENEYVTNIAVIQVLEIIGLHFFSKTLEAVKKCGFIADVFQAHSDDDAGHLLLGLENCAAMDESSQNDCKRVILDLFGLFDDMFTEWMHRIT